MLTINPDTLTDTQAEAAINYILTLRPDCLGESGEEWVATSVQKAFRVETEVPNPTPAVPTPEPPAEGPEGAPDFDSAGLPWDERIHASSKATVADGTWRKKRGVDDVTVAAVEAELRQMDYSTDVTPEAVQKVRDRAAPYLEGAELVPEVPEAPVGESEQVAVPEAPEPTVDAPPAPEANPFLAIMKRVTAAQTAGKFPKEKRDELLAAAGVDSIIKLNNNPDAIATFGALLDAEGL